MKELLEKGLHKHNLSELVKECEKRIPENPVKYYVLSSVFQDLFRTYWDELVESSEEYKKIEPIMIPLIKEVMAVDSPSLDALSKLITTLYSL